MPDARYEPQLESRSRIERVVRAPVFFGERLYALEYRFHQGGLTVFEIDHDPGKEHWAIGRQAALPVTTARSFAASCVFRGRIYVFGARDKGSHRYAVQVSTSAAPVQPNGWSTPQEISGIEGEFREWYSRIPHSIAATTLGDRLYLFYFRDWSICWITTDDGVKWSSENRLGGQHHPWFAVTPAMVEGKPAICVAHTRREEEKVLRVSTIELASDPKVVADYRSFPMPVGWDQAFSMYYGTLTPIEGAVKNPLYVFRTAASVGDGRDVHYLEVDLDGPQNAAGWKKTKISVGLEDVPHRFLDTAAVAVPFREDGSFEQYAVLFVHSADRAVRYTQTYIGKSDLWELVYQSDQRLAEGDPVILGVVEGVPPFTRNGEAPDAATSTVQYGRRERRQVALRSTMETSITSKVGYEDGPVKVSAGVRALFEVTNQLSSTHTSGVAFPFGNGRGANENGEWGWFIEVASRLSGRRYSRRWNGPGGQPLGEAYVVAVRPTFGYRSYKLEEPEPGMTRRPRSSRWADWRRTFPRVDPKLAEPLDVDQQLTVDAGGGSEFLTMIEKEFSRTETGEIELFLDAQFFFGISGSFKARVAIQQETTFSEAIEATLRIPGISGDVADPVRRMVVVARWYLPVPGAKMTPGNRPEWVPSAHVGRGVIPWCMTWSVQEPR
jgi:hypothetical protein